MGNGGIEWEWNKGNAENKGGNSRNGMAEQVQGVSVGMREIWVENRKLIFL